MSCAPSATRTAASIPGWGARGLRCDERARTLERLPHAACRAPLEEVRAAIERGPIDPADALGPAEVSRLLDPGPLAVETGWCTLPDGVGFVAVRTSMPGVNARDGRLVVRLAPARFAALPRLASRRAPRQLARATLARACKAHWGAVHHPVEDVGLGTVHARIAFQDPSEMGLGEDPDRVRVSRRSSAATSAMTAAGSATARCSTSSSSRARALCCAAPSGSAPSCDPTARSAGSASACSTTASCAARRCPRALPRALARHCAEEYANLAVLLPELFDRFGPAAP